MEGVATSRFAMKVDTTTPRVTIATGSYSGGIANVGLFSSSNVVVGAGNAIVLYATGTVAAKNFLLNGTPITAPSTGYAFLAADQTFTGYNFFNGNTNLGQVLVASGTFTATSTMTITFPALSGGLFRLTVGGTKDASAAEVRLRFNNDPEARYDASQRVVSAAGVGTDDGGSDITYCYVGRSGVNVAANGTFMGTWTFLVNSEDTTAVAASGSTHQQTAANEWYMGAVGCRYDGAVTVTSANITTGTGQLLGYMSLVRVY